MLWRCGHDAEAGLPAAFFCGVFPGFFGNPELPHLNPPLEGEEDERVQTAGRVLAGNRAAEPLCLAACKLCSLPCLQGRAGVGCSGAAVMMQKQDCMPSCCVAFFPGFLATLSYPTSILPWKGRTMYVCKLLAAWMAMFRTTRIKGRQARPVSSCGSPLIDHLLQGGCHAVRNGSSALSASPPYPSTWLIFPASTPDREGQTKRHSCRSLTVPIRHAALARTAHPAAKHSA